MAKKYFKLDGGTTGEILAAYARNQPSISGLILLDEPTSGETTWTGSVWEFNLTAYKKAIWKELFQMIKDNLFEIIINKREGGDPTFDFDDVVTVAKNFRTNNAGLTTKEEVDTARENAITWMGLE